MIRDLIELIVFLLVVSFAGVSANAACLAYCNPAVSKPCGKACINKFKQCHKSWAMTCSGVKSYSGSPVYETQTHVEPSTKDPGTVNQ